MAVWSYIAVGEAGSVQRGQASGETAHAVRASLRRVGLRVVDVRAVRSRAGGGASGVIEGHLRRRRAAAKAELFDAMATLIESGLPLVEAIRTVAQSGGAGGRARDAMLGAVQESVAGGDELAGAMRCFPAWFDGSEVAVVAAGQRSGELARALRSLARRHERTAELAERLASALAYPAIVACVGLGVVVFLSTRTLPQLVGVLEEAGVEVPGLTLAVMGSGRFIVANWLALGTGTVIAAMAGLVVSARLRRAVLPKPVEDVVRRAVPGAIGRVHVARLASGLAELCRAGVPLVDAIRVVAPTMSGIVGSALRGRLLESADRVERGEDIVDALDERWFDAEFRQLLAIGVASGELPALLDRIGERYARAARRSIDRFAAMVEPAAILVLAGLIGTIAMAAILPMLKLQEILR